MKKIYKSFCFKAPVVIWFLKLAVDCNAAVERETVAHAVPTLVCWCNKGFFLMDNWRAVCVCVCKADSDKN